MRTIRIIGGMLVVAVGMSARLLAGNGQPALAGSRGSVTISVKESAGLRRFGFPVTARVSLPRGHAPDTANMRLTTEAGAPMTAQFTAMTRHRDNSIDQLEVDFNTSPLPYATQKFFLEYGPGIAAPPITRGLTFNETDEAYEVAGYRIPKQGNLLVSSIRYGTRDYLRPNGLQLAVRAKDQRFMPFRHADVRSKRVEKSGPLNVTIVFEGRYEQLTDPKPMTFMTRLEFVSSKSWVHVTHRVDDPLKKLEEIDLRAVFALDAPLYYDFGVGSWLYGWLNMGERVTLTQNIVSGADDDPTKANWVVTTKRGEEITPYAMSPPDRSRSYAEGWAHLNDAQKVVAIGFSDFADRFGERRIEFEADGATLLRYRPGPDLRPRSPNFFGRAQKLEHELSAYFHFVNVPVQRSAATSPPSMLAPLEVTWKEGRR